MSVRAFLEEVSTGDGLEKPSPRWAALPDPRRAGWNRDVDRAVSVWTSGLQMCTASIPASPASRWLTDGLLSLPTTQTGSHRKALSLWKCICPATLPSIYIVLILFSLTPRIKKQDPTICCLQKANFGSKDKPDGKEKDSRDLPHGSDPEGAGGPHSHQASQELKKDIADY